VCANLDIGELLPLDRKLPLFLSLLHLCQWRGEGRISNDPGIGAEAPEEDAVVRTDLILVPADEPPHLRQSVERAVDVIALRIRLRDRRKDPGTKDKSLSFRTLQVVA
jgi:hypothetical protein